MGATCYRLFDSDHDFDIIGDLDGEVGLYKLQTDAEAAVGFTEDSDLKDDPGFRYTLYCPSDLQLVRKFLETPSAETGVTPLDALLAKKKAIAFGQRLEIDYPDSGYIFVLLGAMTLGCKLSPETLEDMREMFTRSGFMPDALRELDAALNGPKAYNGTPYDFGALGFDELANKPRPVSAGGFVMLNVPSPGGLFAGPDTTQLIAKIKARMSAYKLEKEDREVCGAAECEATKTKADGDLLMCSKCKDRKYCSKDCQVGHWNSHKQVCVKAT
ncbi:Putative Zinc finger, MYND-type [Septoria linicola]|uniref:Zinc finger, MYND-type n=1 Tax=Septoria linicola TaxID=215465 RepID=A0A9Q9ANP9_9PEZI|nr:Putative Zinc finger, MYND-type [Septoria linicola]